jgi:pSer/pThr/pTyr-binding forkhead associated (FHA) protein
MNDDSAWLELPSGEKIPLEDLCSIGRSPGNRIVVTSERVSRKHAVIRRNAEGAYELTDFGSSNGTYLDGHRISTPAVLTDGTIVEIGLEKMTFRHPAAGTRSLPSDEVSTSDCWLLVADATERGCHTPAEGLLDKTRESWNERVQRVVQKYRGTIQRALNEGLLAHWFASDGSASSAAAIAQVLESLRRVQLQTEEFRFVLHYGEVSIRLNPSDVRVPTGSEVMFVMQLQRLARQADIPLLITESARGQLGDCFPTRGLGRTELRDYEGSHHFFTAA